MGSFRYCIHCDAPLRKPDALEDLIESQLCSSCCKPQPTLFSSEEWIIEAFDEIKELEKKFSKAFTRLATKSGARVRRLEKKIKALEKRIIELENK